MSEKNSQLSSSLQNFWSSEICSLLFLTLVVSIPLLPPLSSTSENLTCGRNHSWQDTNNLFATQENGFFSELLLPGFPDAFTTVEKSSSLQMFFSWIPWNFSGNSAGIFFLISWTMLGLGPLLNSSQRGCKMKVLAKSLKKYQSEVSNQMETIREKYQNQSNDSSTSYSFERRNFLRWFLENFWVVSSMSVSGQGPSICTSSLVKGTSKKPFKGLTTFHLQLGKHRKLSYGLLSKKLKKEERRSIC